MPRMDGIAATRLIRRELPESRSRTRTWAAAILS